MAAISFSGLASGIDTDALIKATSDATRSQRVTPHQTKISELSDTNAGISDLKDKLKDLQTASLKFSTLSGGGVAKQGTSSDETKVGATAANSALNGSYTVTVSSLAKNGTISLGPAAGTYTSDTDTISSGTSEVITIGTGANLETVTVPISAGVTTISQFVTSFNSLSTKARASLINVGTTTLPSYRVVINSNKTGTLDGAISVTTNAGGFASPTSSPATDSAFSIAGIGSVTRYSNSVNDVISGLTLDLKAVGTSTVTIADDAETTISVVQDLVTAWNDVVSYISSKNQVTREESGADIKNTFGPLANTQVDDNALSSLRNALAASKYTYTQFNTSTGQTDTISRIFSDLGVTTERDGTLKFKTDTFKKFIASEPLSVNGVLTNFADTVAVTSGTIDQYIRFNGLFDTTTTGNKTLITNLNSRIAEAEATITKTEAAMKQRFATLEATMSKLQGQQSALTSALAGLG